MDEARDAEEAMPASGAERFDPAMGRDDESVSPSLTQQFAPRPPRTPTPSLGWVAVSLAAACVIADVMAVILAAQRYWDSATSIAYGVDVATAIVFVVGLFAAFRRPARWLGIMAMVVAVLANPFILTHLLDFLGG